MVISHKIYLDNMWNHSLLIILSNPQSSYPFLFY